MKQLLLILALLPVVASAQNYLPFDSVAPKRFVNATDVNDNGYYFFSRETSIAADTVFYKQYYQLTDQFVDVSGTTCSGWGGGPVSYIDSTWLGRDFHYKNTARSLHMNNRSGQALTFDFNLPLGDSAIFYQNATEVYYMHYWQKTLENVFGYSDSVKWFRISHFDLMGGPVSSPLHNFNIQLGKDLGLIAFMDCHHFPTSEIGVNLMGQITPRIGNYQMTYEDAFTFATGDTLVYLGRTPFPYAPANYGFYYQSILQYTVTNRVETVDSVYIYLDSAEQIIYPYDTAALTYPPPPPFYNIRYPSPFKFAKRECFFEVPMNSAETTFTTHIPTEENFCGMYKQERQTGSYNVFCDSCSCLPQADGFMQSYYSEYYTVEHGLTYRGEAFYGPYPIYPHASLIYFNSVNLGPCGTPTHLGIETMELNFTIAPNPVRGYLTVTSAIIPQQIELYDLSGKRLIQWSELGTESKLDVSGFSAGMYTLVVQYADRSISRKIVVE